MVPSSKTCVLSAGNETFFDVECTCFRVGSSNRIHRNGWRPWTSRAQTTADLSLSPITRSETNLDMNVEESGPVRAGEFGLERVDEFGHRC